MPRKTNPKRKHVRTGCLVCKQRHLKCDETKPSCKACTAARWICEYPALAPTVDLDLKACQHGDEMSLSLHRPRATSLSGLLEETNFTSFRLAAQNGIASLFGGETWWNLALRASEFEPAVRLATEAVGAIIHRSRPTPQYDDAKTLQWTLVRYNQSITCFNQGVRSPLEIEQTTVVLCLLFFVVEVLFGNMDLALHHLRGGTRIAATLSTTSNSCLSQALNRLQIVARTHSSPTSIFNHRTLDEDLVASPESPKVYQHTGQARNELDLITISTCRMLCHFKVTACSSKAMEMRPFTEIEPLMSLPSLLRARLSKWRILFDQFLDSSGLPSNAGTRSAVCILEIQYHVQFILLSTVLETGEMCYDDFTIHFLKVVTATETLLNTPAYLDASTLSRESSLLAPLFFVGMKCRSGAVRKRLLPLIARCKRREVLWHRESVYQLVNWKMTREQSSSWEDGYVPGEMRVHSEKLEKTVVDGRTMLRTRYKQGSQPTEHVETWTEEATAAGESEAAMDMRCDMLCV